MIKQWIKIISALLLFAFPATSFAEGERMGYTSYYFSDSGGNSVVTNSFNLAKKLLKRTVLLLDLEVDHVSVPPLDGVSGATRPKRQRNKTFEKTRGQAILGLEQGIDGNTSMAVNLYRSQEVDYVSSSIIGSFTRELFSKNTTISLRGQYIDDLVGKILENGDLENRGKQSLWFKAGFGQVLSQNTVLDLSYDMLRHEGFLSDPYRQVQVFDQNNAFELSDELHPGKRVRQAVAGKLSQYIPDVRASLMGSYRYYFDDWQVKSQTLELQFNKYVFKNLISRFNYRYYTQTGSYFTRDRYVGEQFLNDEFRTSDYKLQSFNSNNFGVSVTYLLRGLAESNRDFEFLSASTIELRYFRYFNTLDFSANIFQMNVNFGI